jgi:hypothetical protein
MISSMEFFFEPVDVSVDPFSDRFRSAVEPVGFGHDHLGDLPSAGNQCAQFQSDLIGQGANCWTDRFGKTRQNQSIDPIGLGQLSSSFGEVSDLAGVDHDHGKLGAGQSTHDFAFEPTGSFHNDQGGTDLAKAFDQHFDPRPVVSQRFRFIGRPYRHIESFFGDVDTDKDRCNSQNSFLHYFWFPPSQLNLANDAGLITQATVRAFREAERDDPCCCTIFFDQGNVDLSRSVRVNYVTT